MKQSIEMILNHLSAIDGKDALKILDHINKQYVEPLKSEQSSNDALSDMDPGHCSGHGDASITKTLFDDSLSDIQHINSGESDLNTTGSEDNDVSASVMINAHMVTKDDLMIMNIFDRAVTYCTYLEQIALLKEYKFWLSIKDDPSQRPELIAMM
jgi:hypothetical protein